jgi:hypothetical protein
MLKIGFVGSVNGYGHIRRLLSIARIMDKKKFKVVFYLSCQLNPSSLIVKMIKNQNFEINILCTKYYTDGPYANFNIKCKCNLNINKKNFSEIDILIADSQLWASELHKNTFLIAQFVWQVDYKKENLSYLETQRFYKFRHIFGINDFSLPYLKSLDNFTGIPLLDYWGLRKFGSITSENYISLANNGTQKLDKNLVEMSFGKKIPLIRGLDEFLNTNTKPIAIICRPGLGTILECLSANIVPILLHYTDFELQYNTRVVLQNNWGIAYEDFQAIPVGKKFDFLLSFQKNRQLPNFLSPNELLQLILKKAI